MPTTVARSQVELFERLVADQPATIVVGGELQVPAGDDTIEIDVMDLADDPLPGDRSAAPWPTGPLAHRLHRNSSQKVGSDIHDLVRLVASSGARAVAADLAADAELSTWVAGQLSRAFSTDLRYTLLRLRSNDRSAGAEALTDAQAPQSSPVSSAGDLIGRSFQATNQG